MMMHIRSTLVLLIACSLLAPCAQAEEAPSPRWLWSTAHAVPKETTSEGSGYFSIIEGKDGRIYVGSAKYGHNAYLVAFDPKAADFKVVVDAHKEIGTNATGFAAQAKFHTRNNVGESGRIYLGTKQGYPKDGESRDDYLGGYPMVFDPATGKTRVYDIPVKHQGIISVTPDESRGIAYVSTCSDERPIESTHFLILDLAKGTYRDLMDCRHMYAFIVVDYLGRAYHPILGGEIARYDPRTDKLARLKQTIDGKPPTSESLLAHPQSHPINWDMSPDRKTLYSVAMSGNQLYSYDLTAQGDVLVGRSHGKLIADAESTDCRAMCVGPDGVGWAGVAAKFKGVGQRLHLVSFKPGTQGPIDHGPIAIRNPDYTTFTGGRGGALPWHHGVHRSGDGALLPRYVIMGICAARDGTIYLTTIYPFTLHAIRLPKVAAVVTEYRHNSHADVIASRLLQTHTLDGKGPRPQLQLASLFADQRPEKDLSEPFSKRYQVPRYEKIADALTLGTGKLAVDGVLLIAEHGKYPDSDTGSTMYPKRRLFEEVIEVFKTSDRVVPVFFDKHLSDNWQDAKWIYDTAKAMKVPMIAGSSVPLLWRYPPADVKRGAKLDQIVVVSYHRLDAYGFHALEVVQALAEQRHGGETGVKAVQCLTGEAVWKAGNEGKYDRALLDAALARLKDRPIPQGKRIEDLVREPVLFTLEYEDGLIAHVFTLNHAVSQWAGAWKYAEDKKIESTLFWTQEQRPFSHFSLLMDGIEKLMHTGEAPWPLERTLLTTGALDALLNSRKQGGKRIQTPHLRIPYKSNWRWREPPEPAKGRPLNGQ
ncbi:MAG: hypothetical protein WD768_00690 [Phycisphaeraceae bacterium]